MNVVLTTGANSGLGLATVVEAASLLQGEPGMDARRALGLDDHVLTLKLTPNRADCLSILGVAREVAALTGTRLEAPRIERIPGKSSARHAVRLSSPEGCGRFAGRVIRNVSAVRDRNTSRRRDSYAVDDDGAL